LDDRDKHAGGIKIHAESYTVNGTPYTDRNEFGNWLADRRNNRVIAHRLESCGYVSVRNPDAKVDGLWKVDGRRQVAYCRETLDYAAQLKAIRELLRPAAAPS
jgi:hypothetical protein